MTIPLPIILDVLSEYPITSNIRHLDALHFSWAAFLPREGQRPQQDRLYLCTLKQARKAGVEFDPCCF